MNEHNTITILDELRKELAQAREAYNAKPDYATLQTIRFLESKVMQYTARAEMREA